MRELRGLLRIWDSCATWLRRCGHNPWLNPRRGRLYIQGGCLRIYPPNPATVLAFSQAAGGRSIAYAKAFDPCQRGKCVLGVTSHLPAPPLLHSGAESRGYNNIG